MAQHLPDLNEQLGRMALDPTVVIGDLMLEVEKLKRGALDMELFLRQRFGYSPPSE
mgnify:CR=1 FL=1